MPRWFGGDGNLPLSNPVLNGLVMSALALITIQPSMGKQFGILIGVTSVLTLSIYAVCSIGLFRAAPSMGWRVLAVAGLVFSVFAVIAAAGGYVFPTVGFFVLVSLGWFLVRRKHPVVIDPPAPPL